MAKQNPFDQKKASILAEIQSEAPDLSPKGDVDVLCFPIINLINTNADMVTTSSCSGRISIFLEGDKNHKGSIKSGGKGEGGRWLYVTHNVSEVSNWIDRIESESFEFSDPAVIAEQFDSDKRLVLYKYEPFILHVKCRDFSTASKLYNVAMGCGFRESGIGSNNLVAIRTSSKLDIPMGIWDSMGNHIKFLVDKHYIKMIDAIAIAKFGENERKMTKLYERIKSDIFEPVP